MKKLFSFPGYSTLLLFNFLCVSGFSQSDPTQKTHLEAFFKSRSAFQTALHAKLTNPGILTTGATVYVGKPYTASDTITLTGAVPDTFKGRPIWVVGNGVFKIHKATVDSFGNMYILQNGQVIIDSSSIHFPQAYFYELSIFLAGNGRMNATNSTFNYDSKPHGLGTYDSSKLIMKNVVVHGFTTTGLNGKGSMNINTCDSAEFLVGDSSRLVLKKTTYDLIWHEFPGNSIVNFSFGKGDTAYGYVFDKTRDGIGTDTVKNIKYSIQADSVNQILWGMMPSAGSKVTIHDSKIRSIGVLFDHPQDSVVVSGIFDNSAYTNFIAPLKLNGTATLDRTLRLVNDTVTTWSLYVAHKSILNVSSCTAGEIGAEGSSKVYGLSYTVDGSGGYHWASDTSKIFSYALNAATTYVRSEKNGFFLIEYSTLGIPVAIDQSILIVVQSQVGIEPTALSGSVAWFNRIDQPSVSIYADSSVQITGSAWIDQGPTSVLMNFKNWQLYYEKQGTSTWIPITGAVNSKASHIQLASWSTHGLSSGTYSLQLVLRDTWGDSIGAVIQVNVLPPVITGMTSFQKSGELNFFPNPSTGVIHVSEVTQEEPLDLQIMDLQGKIILREHYTPTNASTEITCDASSLAKGVYMIKLIQGDQIKTGKLFIQ